MRALFSKDIDSFFTLFSVVHYADEEMARVFNCKFLSHFLMHMILFPFIGIVLKVGQVGEEVRALTLVIGSVVASLLITMVLRKSMPRVAMFLFGGR